MTAAEQIADFLRSKTYPVSRNFIMAATELKGTTAKAAIVSLIAAGKVAPVGGGNSMRYMIKAQGPKCAPSSICHGSMRAPLVYSRMHSDRPGAMDYQSIPSLVGRERVPYRAGVVR